MNAKAGIAEQVRAFLEITKMPVRQLGIKAGVNPSSICNLKTGKRSDVVSAAADALRHAMKSLNYDAAKQAGVE